MINNHKICLFLVSLISLFGAAIALGMEPESYDYPPSAFFSTEQNMDEDHRADEEMLPITPVSIKSAPSFNFDDNAQCDGFFDLTPPMRIDSANQPRRNISVPKKEDRAKKLAERKKQKDQAALDYQLLLQRCSQTHPSEM